MSTGINSVSGGPDLYDTRKENGCTYVGAAELRADISSCGLTIHQDCSHYKGCKR